MKRGFRAHGLTAIELLAVLICLAVFVFVGLIIMSQRPRHRGVRSMYDATQVRGTQQAMAIWANEHHGLYPRPSAVDVDDATVRESGTAKDTTANILSLLIYTGGISVELLYSPAESNTGGIQQDDDYMFEAPKAAVNPEKALWDPAFSADFTGQKVGNTSYAHILPSGARWRDTFVTTEPVIGNRGPQVTGINPSNRARYTYANPDSNTFLIHGSRSSWEGNIAYNDGHVNFETKVAPDGIIYKNAAGKWSPDCIFFDEPDAAADNAWMSIWTTAGAEKKDFTPIWD